MLRCHYKIRYGLVECSLKSFCVQVVSGAGSGDHEKSERSMRKADKGVVVGVREVSETEQ